MAATTYYLSIPVSGGRCPIILDLESTKLADAREEADAASPVYFYAAGYEDSETVYGTLYALTARGRLAHSECFPISGPPA